MVFAPLLISLAAATTTLWTFMVVSKMFYNGTLRELPVKIKRKVWRSSVSSTGTAATTGKEANSSTGEGEKCQTEGKQRTLRNRINLAKSHDRWRFVNRLSAKALLEDLYGSGREKRKSARSGTAAAATTMATAAEVVSVNGVGLNMVQPPPVLPRVASETTEFVDELEQAEQEMQEEGLIDLRDDENDDH